MSLTIEEVLKIAKLSRIRLDEQQLSYFQTELSKIMNWIDILKEVDTKNVLPTTSVVGQALPLRTDKVTDGNISDSILKNAPESGYDCFVVPKVVE